MLFSPFWLPPFSVLIGNIELYRLIYDRRISGYKWRLPSAYFIISYSLHPLQTFVGSCINWPVTHFIFCVFFSFIVIQYDFSLWHSAINQLLINYLLSLA